MPTWPAWKRFEQRIFRRLGGDRRGPGTSKGRQGETDSIDTPGLACEAKLLKTPHYQAMFNACLQAEENAKGNDIPVAFVKRRNRKDSDALVVMRFEIFEKIYLNLRVGNLEDIERIYGG